MTDSDEGKKVITADNKTLGRIVEVDEGRAYVNPDPKVGDTMLSTLGWEDRDEGTFALESDRVAEITDEEVRLTPL